MIFSRLTNRPRKTSTGPKLAKVFSYSTAACSGLWPGRQTSKCGAEEEEEEGASNKTRWRKQQGQCLSQTHAVLDWWVDGVMLDVLQVCHQLSCGSIVYLVCDVTGQPEKSSVLKSWRGGGGGISTPKSWTYRQKSLPILCLVYRDEDSTPIIRPCWNINIARLCLCILSDWDLRWHDCLSSFRRFYICWIWHWSLVSGRSRSRTQPLILNKRQCTGSRARLRSERCSDIWWKMCGTKRSTVF